ncbi:MAG: right-handed parallel beta-helix repeat-containing protein [Acidimicrobiales bacterium]|jgi:hypothetical protein|nr:right-handed parallel beta-helix repeat-containing protein [Acidimicrobiales bacterium]
MMRRSVLQLIALLAVLGLIAAACSDDGDTTDTTVDPAPAEETDDPADEPDEPVDEPDELVEPELDYAVHSVPADYDTIQAAVDSAAPGDLVLIDEGIYTEEVIVQTDDIVIRGVNRNTVILDGEYDEEKQHGIIIFSDGVAVENMTVRNFPVNGVFWTGDYGADDLVEGFRGSYLTVHNYGVYGIYATGSMNGQLEHSYASGGDDAAFYIGQCVACNALLYNVEGVNSQLGYSGTNSSGVIIANSNFHDNMMGVVNNSAGTNDRTPHTGTIIVGNRIHHNNNTLVPSNNAGFRLGVGSGVVLAGTVGNTVERNLIVDNDRAGVIILDWIDAIFASGNSPDFLAMDNVVRDNHVAGSSLEADFLVALNNIDAGGNGNCFAGNTYDVATPADIETVLPCDGDDTAVLTPLAESLDKFATGFEPIDYKDVPVPEYNFETMPGDPWTDPPVPAHDLPMALDLDSLTIPEG